MRYVKNRKNRKKYYPFYDKNEKAYVLCEAAIFAIEMTNEPMKMITIPEKEENLYEDICQIPFEFQELLVRIAKENEELAKESHAVLDEIQMLCRYVKESLSLYESEEEGTDSDAEEKIERLSLDRFTLLLETIEERSRLLENPKKHMPAINFEFETYEEEGERKTRLTRYLGSKKKNLKVPELYGYHRICSIGDNAFANSKYLETVILPDSVEDIGNECFRGINSMKKIVFEEKETFSPLHYTRNGEEIGFLFFVTNPKTLQYMIPDSSYVEEPDKKIAFTKSGLILMEERKLTRIHLVTGEVKQLEMDENVAARLEETLVEAGTLNRKFIEESRFMFFFWKELRRYSQQKEDALRNLNFMVSGVDEIYSVKEQDGELCFFAGEKEISIMDVIIRAAEKGN